MHGKDDDDDGALDHGYDFEEQPDEARYPMVPAHENEDDEHSDSFSFDDHVSRSASSSSREDHYHMPFGTHFRMEGPHGESHQAFLSAQMPFVNILW